jgi:hypothetical protein
MGKTPSESLELIATRVPSAVGQLLHEHAAAEGMAVSYLARLIIENYFHVGLPPQMRTALEGDEKRLKLNRRDYVNELRYARVQAIERKGKR